MGLFEFFKNNDSSEVATKNLVPKDKLEKVVYYSKIVTFVYLMFPIILSLLALSKKTIQLSHSLQVFSFICMIGIVILGANWIENLIGKQDIKFPEIIEFIPKWSKILCVVTIIYLVPFLIISFFTLPMKNGRVDTSGGELISILLNQAFAMMAFSLALSHSLGEIRYFLIQRDTEQN